MDFILAKHDYVFQCSVFGVGRLEKGKTYYCYSKLAKDLSEEKVAEIISGDAPANFRPGDINRIFPGAKVLLIHSGGFGDTVSLGIVLERFKKERGLNVDVCCCYDKYAQVLLPMGFNGRWLGYPLDVEVLEEYELLVPELSKLIPDQKRLIHDSPVRLLSDAFDISDVYSEGRYFIPKQIKKQMQLPEENAVRIGVSFDSDCKLRSYPKDVQEKLLELFGGCGFEVHLLGKEKVRKRARAGLLVNDHRDKTSILELAALLEQMDFVLAVNSFVANLSGLLGKRTLVLMSTTGRGIFDHFSSVSSICSEIECSPCGSVLANSQCPLGYSKCKAFFHKSIDPRVILARVIKELTDDLRDKL